MEFIYPKPNTKVFLPKDFNEIVNDVVLKVAHQNPNAKVYWYLNNSYLGIPQTIHEMTIKPKEGKYIITATDNFGNDVKEYIQVLQ